MTPLNVKCFKIRMTIDHNARVSSKGLVLVESNIIKLNLETFSMLPHLRAT